MKSRTILALAALAVVILAVTIVLLFVDVIPDSAMTMTAMTETSFRIGMFVDRNKQLPQNLDVLPKRDGYANRTTDAWKRPLIYAVDSKDTFMLTSLGRDGVVGGKGDDADISFKYKVTNGQVREMP